jgi:hypothetical protein
MLLSFLELNMCRRLFPENRPSQNFDYRPVSLGDVLFVGAHSIEYVIRQVICAGIWKWLTFLVQCSFKLAVAQRECKEHT